MPGMSQFGKVLVLAVVQGLTEFLPVSSSGHLVLLKHMLALDAPGATLEVALHAGTLLSVALFYRRRIGELALGLVNGRGDGRFYVLLMALSCLPAGIVYVFLGDRLETLFDSPFMAGVMLCVTGLILLSGLLRRDAGEQKLSMARGFLMGLAQAVALLPGISRSGTTITVGRHLGLSARKTAEFSLLMALPLIAGATLLKALTLAKTGMGEVSPGAAVAGMAMAAVVGYFAIAWLLRALTHGKFWLFGVYCLVVGGLAIALA